MKVNFRISVPKPKTKAKKTVILGKHQGVVYLDENNEYRVLVDIVKSEDEIQEKVSLPFTDESYELKGRQSIFTRKRYEYGYIRIMRNKEYADSFPGSKEHYVPFAPKSLVIGDIIREEEKLKFDFKGLVYED